MKKLGVMMKNHFHPKSLLFYGTMIGTVTLLFRYVALYGEAHLQAPSDVNGRYVSAVSLSGCPDTTRIGLDLQQSGIYISGSLRLLDQSQNTASNSPPPTAEEKPSLHGLLQSPPGDTTAEQSSPSDSQQIMISGIAPLLSTCQIAGNPANPALPVSLQGTIDSAGRLRGELTLGASTDALELTIQPEATDSASPGH